MLELRARQHRERVRTDREERRVAEVEQAGEADHDVEAERQQHERAGVGEEVDETAVRKHQRHHDRGTEVQIRLQPSHHTLAGSDSPSSPDGRKIKTSTSTENTTTLLH